MNWDWEKLQKQNKQHGGGQGAGPPPQFDEMLEKAMTAISELINLQKKILSQKP